jgi:predicted nucleotidyltransferase
MRQQIITALKALEVEKNIKIIYAVESGSRAWGFASDNSDWDVRFIYVHQKDWYLDIDTHKDTIDRMLPDDLDLSGWEVQKALRLFRKSNPSLMEWLESPIVYLEAEALMKEWRTLADIYFNPKNEMYHYLNMARNTYRNYLEGETVKIKKYFYALRPLFACRWIMEKGKTPPVLFSEMLADFKNEEIHAIIEELLIEKRSAKELGERPIITNLNKFLLEEITFFTTYLESFKNQKVVDSKPLNDFFKTVLSKNQL